jgi:uncharacterized damage-inducible protein DinB
MQQNVQSDTSVLTVLFKHNAWANLKLLDFCEALSSEQLDATAIGCYGSIRDTLRHIVGAEVGYVSNATGRPKAPPLNWDAGFGAVKDAVRQAADDLLDLAISAREGTIVRQPQPEGRDSRGVQARQPDGPGNHPFHGAQDANRGHHHAIGHGAA